MLAVVQRQPNTLPVADFLVRHPRSLVQQANTTGPLCQLAGQSTRINTLGHLPPNADGFGVLGFDAQYQVVGPWRSLQPLNPQQPLLQNALAPLAQQAQVVLAHIRAASVGSAQSPLNNHPFVLPLLGQTWAFMANGTLRITPSLYRRYTQGPHRQAFVANLAENPSPTDSQQVFHMLLQAMAPSLPLATPHILRELHPLLQRISQRYRTILKASAAWGYAPFGPACGYPQASGPLGFVDATSQVRKAPANSFVLSNGALTLVGVWGNDVWYQLKQAEATGAVEGVVLASEPTNLSAFYAQGETFAPGWSRWQQLPNETLVALWQHPHTKALHMGFSPL
jgi:hypothetical protein